MQYAESLFLSRELFSTEDRRGILLLVSQFERQVVILPDKGVRDLLSEEVLKEVIANMTLHLRRNEIRQALETGLEGIQAALGSTSTWEGPAKMNFQTKLLRRKAYEKVITIGSAFCHTCNGLVWPGVLRSHI